MQIVPAFLTNNPCYKANATGADSRYTQFQQRGPQGFILHSVGCAQPNAQSFVTRWNRASYDRACVHAFIDCNTQTIYQTLPWNYRAWHCGGSANNTHIGVEMCEPAALRYQGVSDRFTVSDAALKNAQEQVKRSYNTAVELVAHLAKKYGWDVTKDGVILSHREAGKRGIASGHTDPEHLWTQLGLPYTMSTFRSDVAKKMGIVTQPVISTPVQGADNPTITTCRPQMPVLNLGVESNACRMVMLTLRDRGYYPEAISLRDKTFGPKMLAAVKAFQKVRGLDADGVVGEKTWAMLAEGK